MHKESRPSRTLKFKDTLNLLLGAGSVALLLSATGVNEWAEGLSVNKTTKWIILGTESWNEASDDFGLNFARNKVRAAFFEFKDMKFWDVDGPVARDESVDAADELSGDLRAAAIEEESLPGTSSASTSTSTSRSREPSRAEKLAGTSDSLPSSNDKAASLSVKNQNAIEEPKVVAVASEPVPRPVRKFGEISEGEKRLLAQGISQVDEDSEAETVVAANGAETAALDSNEDSDAKSSVNSKDHVSKTQEPRAPGSRKKRILLMGDSMLTSGLHVPLKKNLKRVFVNASVDVEGHPGTGLVKPKFFSWPKKLTEYKKKSHYDLVLIFLGTNDAQNFLFNHRVHKFASKNWDSVYADRALNLVEQACGMADQVVWMGQLPMKDSEFDIKMKHIDELMGKTLQNHSCSSFMPALHWVENETGGFASIKAVPVTRTVAAEGNSAKTQQVQIRSVDGIHFSLVGARHYSRILAEQIAKSLKKDMKTEPVIDSKVKEPGAEDQESSDVSRKSVSDANI